MTRRLICPNLAHKDYYKVNMNEYLCTKIAHIGIYYKILLTRT